MNFCYENEFLRHPYANPHPPPWYTCADLTCIYKEDIVLQHEHVKVFSCNLDWSINFIWP